MNVLLIYPEYPDTFWSFKHALKFVSQKASFPPLGLITLATMLPERWDKKLLDLNVKKLREKDIIPADLIFISAMSVQSSSVKEIISLCKRLDKKIVAGGPLFTSSPENYQMVDYLVLNEAEITLPLFIKDFYSGDLKHIYSSTDFADIKTTPIPQWNLVEMAQYTSMNLQYSRGCPFDCDFCDITVLYGRKPRTKNREQVLAELDALFNAGWRGPVFFVDDNFIGNKPKLKTEILPAITEWMKAKKYPFYLNTEASINLADDAMLMDMMIEAGFESVFIGIESPNEKSLAECNKVQNQNRNMIESIKKIQLSGLEVQGGFIVGFDNDHQNIFEDLTNFIQKSNIVTAMVGLLNAPRGTKLEERLLSEGRMLKDFTGNNTDFSINFIPKMDYDKLLSGYKSILNTIYSPKYYYERTLNFIKTFSPKQKKVFHFNPNYTSALIKSIIKLGIIGEERFYYWKLFLWTLFRKPKLFSLAILFSIYGFHFRKISNDVY
ncbi:MAG: B12-binding domain-containing radical SAM protein [Ignavibacteriales bacterium]|nr:B12-binding domain-containing radical SAM protein [Ignavibacteriales bacterium]MCF8306953.1 B12-binding domain-containing radical SAM protein [Ignavibacteriales bacterium]MCF8437393.1 B12-binding domain-containing radical SAM protein [Ignavibacteriales bacterium]